MGIGSSKTFPTTTVPQIVPNKYKKSDTPFACLNRMVAAIKKNDFVWFYNEIRYFWNRPWKLHKIQDPRDENPSLDYALNACIVERLVEVFNERKLQWNISRPVNRFEPERVPEWTQLVAPSPTFITLFSEENPGTSPLAQLMANPIFKKRNIHELSFVYMNYLLQFISTNLNVVFRCSLMQLPNSVS